MNIFQRVAHAVRSAAQTLSATIQTAQANQLERQARRLTRAAEKAQENAQKAREKAILEPPERHRSSVTPTTTKTPELPPTTPISSIEQHIRAAAGRGDDITIVARWDQYPSHNRSNGASRHRSKAITVPAATIVAAHDNGMGWGEAAMDTYGPNIGHVGAVLFEMDGTEWDEDYETDGGY